MENALPRRLAVLFGVGIASPMMYVVAKQLSCCFLLAACEYML